MLIALVKTLKIPNSHYYGFTTQQRSLISEFLIRFLES